MSKEDVINYVMTTPNNPNRAVLEGMLDSIAEVGAKILTITVETENFNAQEYNSYGSQTGIKPIPLKPITLSEGTLEELLADASIIESYDVVVTKLITNMTFGGSPIVTKTVSFASTAYSPFPFGGGIGLEADVVSASGGIYDDRSSYKFTASLNNDEVSTSLTYSYVRYQA